MKAITPCLWLDSGAEDAAEFYVSVFKDGKILDTATYLTETPSNKPVGSVLTVTLEIGGQPFMLLNGGPIFTQSEAVSFVIPCDTQEEMDYYYDALSAHPESEICGWVKDKFGVSWQVVPSMYDEFMKSADPEKKKRVMQKVLDSKRLNIEELKSA